MWEGVQMQGFFLGNIHINVNDRMVNGVGVGVGGSHTLNLESPNISHSKKKEVTCLNALSPWEKPWRRLVVAEPLHCKLLRWEYQVGVDLHKALGTSIFFS